MLLLPLLPAFLVLLLLLLLAALSALAAMLLLLVFAPLLLEVEGCKDHTQHECQYYHNRGVMVGRNDAAVGASTRACAPTRDIRHTRAKRGTRTSDTEDCEARAVVAHHPRCTRTVLRFRPRELLLGSFFCHNAAFEPPPRLRE